MEVWIKMKVKNLYNDMAVLLKSGERILVKVGETKEADFDEEDIKRLVEVGKLEIPKIKKKRKKGD